MLNSWACRKPAEGRSLLDGPQSPDKGFRPTSVIQGPFMGKIVFGKPFLLYHRSGFHSPQPVSRPSEVRLQEFSTQCSRESSSSWERQRRTWMPALSGRMLSTQRSVLPEAGDAPQKMYKEMVSGVLDVLGTMWVWVKIKPPADCLF